VLHEKNGQQRYKYFVLGSDKSYFAYKKTKKQQQTNKQTKIKKKTTLILPKQFSESDVTKMLELLLDSIFVMFGGRVFQHSRNTYG
jgi:hypothetical protein